MKSDTTTLPAPAAAKPAASADLLIEALSRLQNEADRMLDDSPARFPGAPFGSLAEGLAVPALEMTETDKAYKITAELPGIEPDDVDVSFGKGILIIAGEKKSEREENERGYKFSERTRGRFERMIELPAATKIKASFRKGVLKVTVAKNGKAEPASRRIAINKG